MDDFHVITVTCHAGFCGEEYPRAFVLEGRYYPVVRVLRRWRNPEWRCFVAEVEGAGCFLLRHDAYRQLWEGKQCRE